MPTAPKLEAATAPVDREVPFIICEYCGNHHFGGSGTPCTDLIDDANIGGDKGIRMA